MMSSDHGQDAGKMPVPLFGKIAAALVKSFAENAPMTFLGRAGLLPRE
jgi:hypothetical protein